MPKHSPIRYTEIGCRIPKDYFWVIGCGLNPGKYTVVAFEDLQEDVHQPEFLKSYRTRGETVQLDEGNRKNVVLKLIPYDAEVP
jgi:hypothetical protein